METQETSVIQCKHCNIPQKRLMDGRYGNQKDIRWIDPETGRQWNGHCCPSCHAEKAALRKRNQSKAK